MKLLLHSRYLMMLVAAALVVSVGCSKIKQRENSVTVTETPGGDPTLVGGKGGYAGLKITPNHDNWNIDSCMVYVKYNTSVVPASGRYDDSVWVVKKDGIPIGTFLNLKPGNYYIFGKGWDLVRSEKVRGGMPFIIPQDQSNAIHSIVLPVYDYN